MKPAKLDQISRAREAWGEAIPAEVLALAHACRAQTSRAVARRLGYSDAVVSHVLAKKYPGDVAKVFATIRGSLMGETVDCPELGELRRDQCLHNQARPFSSNNSASARLFHACKTCPNRQLKDVA